MSDVAFRGGAGVRTAIRAATSRGVPALAAFVTAGYPDKETFPSLLREIARVADVVEIGVPFSDPMADGVTIQRSSRAALESGVSLDWILRTLGSEDLRNGTPLLLMSYLNPLLAYGLDRLAETAEAVGVNGFIVPDLPLEESPPFRDRLGRRDLALVQLVTPVTPSDRLTSLCEASGGFVYAVTVTGTTGASLPKEDFRRYLGRVRAASRLPVLAGFGIRSPEAVRAIRSHCDGVVVGTALIEVIERGEDPASFLRGLRGSPVPQARGVP